MHDFRNYSFSIIVRQRKLLIFKMIAVLIFFEITILNIPLQYDPVYRVQI